MVTNNDYYQLKETDNYYNIGFNNFSLIIFLYVEWQQMPTEKLQFFQLLIIAFKFACLISRISSLLSLTFSFMFHFMPIHSSMLFWKMLVCMNLILGCRLKTSQTANVSRSKQTRLNKNAIIWDNTIYKFSIKLSFWSIGQDKLWFVLSYTWER